MTDPLQASEQSSIKDDGDDRVYLCVICGAVLTKGSIRMHNEWHDRLDKRMTQAHSPFGGGIFGLDSDKGRL